MTSKMIKKAALALILTWPGIVNAQFNTISKKTFTGYEFLTVNSQSDNNTDNQIINRKQEMPVINDTIAAQDMEKVYRDKKKCVVRKKHHEYSKHIINREVVESGLPSLTIPNLLAEIRKNGIRHEKIVLAQAILETGWFRSPVCRNKNNLFGLTNPRTGQYYEFKHWTESVRAYYTKVQYRFKEGNYLMWLDRIGYAEDPRYVSSLIKILRNHIL